MPYLSSANPQAITLTSSGRPIGSNISGRNMPLLPISIHLSRPIIITWFYVIFLVSTYLEQYPYKKYKYKSTFLNILDTDLRGRQIFPWRVRCKDCRLAWTLTFWGQFCGRMPGSHPRDLPRSNRALLPGLQPEISGKGALFGCLEKLDFNLCKLHVKYQNW